MMLFTTTHSVKHLGNPMKHELNVTLKILSALVAHFRAFFSLTLDIAGSNNNVHHK